MFTTSPVILYGPRGGQPFELFFFQQITGRVVTNCSFDFKRFPRTPRGNLGTIRLLKLTVVGCIGSSTQYVDAEGLLAGTAASGGLARRRTLTEILDAS